MPAPPTPRSRPRAASPAPTPAAAALTGAVLGVFRTNGLLVAWGDRFVAPLGLTSSRWQMLGAIALAPRPLAAPALAAAMGVTRQGALKQLDLLVEDGLVERLANAAHQRSPLHALTERGRRVYARVDEGWNAWAEELAARLPAGDVKAAQRFLDALAAALARELEAAR